MTNTDSTPLKRSSTGPLRLGIAGLGTVGIGVIRLLRAHPALTATRTGRPLEVVAVSARNRQRDRGEDLSAFHWYDDPLALAHAPDVDVVVELMGGAGDPAYALVTRALENGKAVVTANKALIALHGNDLARLSARKKVPLYFEAAVAGGVPAVKMVREGVAGDALTQLGGILNGTCNYILTQMEETGRDFADVLKEAQDMGYAEADPSTDVDGWDTAHKLAILTGLAFQPIAFDSLDVQGIRAITTVDLHFAKELGYRIKLLGVAHRGQNNEVSASVQPCLVPLKSGLAQVGNAFNALTTEGPFSGPLTISGQGAGEGPTATAVVADLIDLGRGHHVPLWGAPPPEKPAICQPIGQDESPFYLRLTVKEHAGLAKEISELIGKHGIKTQHSAHHNSTGTSYITIVTHPTLTSTLRSVLPQLKQHDAVQEAPLALKIENMP
ncbi:homoserine dehydrogenase [Saccharibacter sp. 17.LH.SD]|uniref:homoserine dehydrogenase n=1 Tax=Saccharibacter sp. 17.LH.SD TaxID=2689393 RepID=UPI001370EDC6|nr:homoserine dehydrogenase [Saccharibacter sp. 17.LH.SD]MXV45084.1 homoserine dehydrogenase [Saccharibacter sp. 17.LH.SD]